MLPNTPDPPSQPPVERSSPLESVWPPIRDGDRKERSLFIYPRTNKEIHSLEMLEKLRRYDLGRIPEIEIPEMKKTLRNQQSTYCDYLNRLSAAFRDRNKPYGIEFRQMESKRPQNHPTDTKCRPDFVAVRDYGDPQISSNEISWAHVEATGKEDSGQTKADSEAQAGAYTTYHLQARPDLVSVVGIFVRASDFKLFFSNACQVYHTPAIKWTDDIARQLLSAWMYRLHHPEVDPTITVNLKTSPATFTVKPSEGPKCDQLIILRVGECIGRRSTILGQADSESSTIIKEQYVEKGRRFKEGPILSHIHQDGQFPGVVRLEHHEYVKAGDKEISVEHWSKKPASARTKVRLVLKDRGIRMMDVKTPRVLLMGMYDLLEISRILYRKFKILHRDISPGNILFRQNPAMPTARLRSDLGDMCFSEYLLNRFAGQLDSDTESDRQQRLEMRVISIDFDNAEMPKPDNLLGEPMARTGTPAFMARMVRSNEYPAGLFRLPDMPDVAPELQERYKSTLENRVNDFPLNTGEVIEIEQDSMANSSKFQHRLRYDAESVFWCLLWWCMQAKPKDQPDEPIPTASWLEFMGLDDKRDGNFISKFPKNCLHSSYDQLYRLLNDMRLHLQGDLDFSKRGDKVDPEYIHEVFQRLILNFLYANYTEKFMDLEKADKSRVLEMVPMGWMWTASSTDRMHSSIADKE